MEKHNTKEIREELSKYFKDVQSNISTEYKEAEDALRFKGGDQWEPSYVKVREGNDRPMMVKNFTLPIIQRIVNPFIKYPFGIKANANNPEVTEKVQGVIKGVEKASNASEAYENAFDNAVTCGYGAFGIFTDYINDESLEQKPYIGLIRDPLSVLPDPFDKSIDGSKATKGALIDYISEDQAKREYGKDKGGESFVNKCIDGIDIFEYWNTPDNSVPKVTYYKLNSDRKMRVWYSDGSFLDGDETPQEGLVEVGHRMIATKFVKVYTYVGQHLVNYTELPCTSIPIIPVRGDVVFKENREIGYAGVVRKVRDSQQMVNFYASNEAELSALAPKAPFIAYGQQIEPYMKEWENANTDNPPVLRVDADATGAGGQMLPLPQRADNTAQTQHLIASGSKAQEDMNRESGIFDTMFAKEDAGDRSGRALLIQKGIGELSTINYTDNLRKSITRGGEVLLEILFNNEGVHDYDVIDKNGEANVERMDLSSLNMSDFDISISSGPMYESQRDELRDKILSIYQIDPQKGGLLLDLMIDENSSSEARLVKERLEKTLPAELREQDENAPDPQAVQALEQAEQVINEQNQSIEMYEGIISQLQFKMMDDAKDREASFVELETKLKADYNKELLKQEQENYRAELKANTSIDQEGMKQEGSSKRELANIIADAEKDVLSGAQPPEETYLSNPTKGLPQGPRKSKVVPNEIGDQPTATEQETSS